MRNRSGIRTRSSCAAMLLIVVGLPISAQNPIQAAKDAYDKARQQKQNQQQVQPQPAGQRSERDADSINTSGPFTPPPDVKIDSMPVAPFIQGVQFAVSPHGIHVAIPGLSGSRQVVLYDNVAGPKFDRLFPEGDGSSPIIFSPDGKRYAYCGAVGNGWVVMVDGKELVGGPADAGGGMGTYNCVLGFTSNSRHLYFRSQRDSNGPSRIVFDGKPGPWGFIEGNPVFSPDGDHYAYMLSDGKQATQLYVDGQPAPYNAGAPQWTATNHLYTTRASSRPSGPIVDVLVDGKPAMRTNGVLLYMPRAGDMVVAKVTSGRVQFLVAGGKRVPGSEVPAGGGSGDVVFSPDGKHYAVRMSGANQAYVFTDGQKGMGYQRLDSVGGAFLTKADPIAFSPDSSKLVYGAFNNNSNFIIYGGEESDPVPSPVEGAFSQVGAHFLSTGFGVVTLDGKVLKLPNVNRNSSEARSLGFSPDGTHYAFVVRNAGMFTLYLDGVPKSGYYWAGASTTTKRTIGAYAFSPDSKHIAYFCRSSNPTAGNDLYLCLDNRAVRLTGAVGADNLAFTPDGNHLIWTVSRPQSGWRVLVDGKPVAEGFGRLSDETWQPGPEPDSWSFLLQDNDGLKRFIVTPSTAASYTTLFGSGVANDGIK